MPFMSLPATDATATATASLRVVSERVERRLAAVFRAEVARWSALDPALSEPLRSLERLVMAGGKRLRPAFCHWGVVAAGGDPDESVVVDVGAAFEFLQAFALIHDDVMDDGAVRRGTRTAHLEYGERHTVEGWRGEARRFGEGVAILVGDLAHVYADLMMAGAPPGAVDVWNELRVELNIGQYLDILGTVRADTDLAAARRVARYKSGKYTIERPLHVGAALAGRYAELGGALSAYGDPLGEAFQLRDDLLGVFGDEAKTGKPVGDDLREGKPTPLMAVATEQVDRRGAALLARVGADDLADDEITALQRLLVDCGALAEIEEAISLLVDRALGAIDVAPVPIEAKSGLNELAYYVAWRDS